MAVTSFRKKNYIKGGAREMHFDNGGSNIKVDLYKEALDQLPVNANGYIKLIIAPLKNVDKFGNTHCVYENDFMSQKVTGSPLQGEKTFGVVNKGKVVAPKAKVASNDLPF